MKSYLGEESHYGSCSFPSHFLYPFPIPHYSPLDIPDLHPKIPELYHNIQCPSLC